MDKLLALACFGMGVAIVVLAFPEGNVALLLTAAISFLAVWLIRYAVPDESLFVTRVFIVALLARLGFGLIIHVFDLRAFFGGDALTYDFYGNQLMESWFSGFADPYGYQILEYRVSGVGWGMIYLVGGLYTVVGRNILAAQFFSAIVGAGIAPLVFVCSKKIFNNLRAAKVAAIAVAVYPAFIIWTGQLLKDGLIVFMLVLCMIMVLNLVNRFKISDFFFLIVALFGIISLRFYIFYVVAIAVVGAFIMVREVSPRLVIRNLIILLIVGVALTYVGVIRYATEEFDKYGDLERVQISRQDLADTESGFAPDVDVSTAEGVVTAIPLGLIYLLLAPFPWDMANLRQTVTLPDMMMWWASIPFLISGLYFAVRNRLQRSAGILIFSILLCLAYAAFLGNIGTAYRQRIQIQVFLFMFVGVGITLFLEKRENRAAIRKAKNRRPRALQHQ